MHGIPYGKQYISEDDVQSVVDCLQSDFLTQGPKIEEFEIKFAKYVGCEFAVAVSNGTAALHLSSLALGIEKGDKVITTPITFAATANSILYSGGEIGFVDINPNTYLIDLNQVEDRLKSNEYKGIIPVDFTGLSVNLEELRGMADKFGAWIIEDACHAPGGSFKNRDGQNERCGNGKYANTSIFSFHPVKHIATGEGGMVTTNDERIAEKIRSLRTHGITKEPNLLTDNHGPWHYEMHELGYNYRLTDIQAALGLSQLKKAHEGIAKRRAIAKNYDLAFENIPEIRTQSFNSETRDFQHAFHLYIIRTKNRKALYEYLKSKKIYCQIHYIPVYSLPYYRKKYGTILLPHAEDYYKECISLPMFPSLSEEEQSYVIDQVGNFFRND